jgi:hypothetical protein
MIYEAINDIKYFTNQLYENKHIKMGRQLTAARQVWLRGEGDIERKKAVARSG